VPVGPWSAGQPRNVPLPALIAGRQVVSYYVLERIALRLNIPRGWMGLCYTDDVVVGIVSGGGL